MIESGGMEAATARFLEIKKSGSGKFVTSERSLSDLADLYREKGQSDTADQVEALIQSDVKVEVTVAQLEKLVGKYNLSDDFAIQISRRGKRLRAQATGQGELKLTPISERRFKLVGVEAEISFLLENGEATSLTLHQGGVNQVAAKSDE